jgi:hypothetical protein
MQKLYMVIAEVKYNSKAYNYGNKKIRAKCKVPILLKKLEQAEVGQLPYFLHPCSANGSVRILRVSFATLTVVR